MTRGFEAVSEDGASPVFEAELVEDDDPAVGTTRQTSEEVVSSGDVQPEAIPLPVENLQAYRRGARDFNPEARKTKREALARCANTVGPGSLEKAAPD